MTSMGFFRKKAEMAHYFKNIWASTVANKTDTRP